MGIAAEVVWEPVKVVLAARPFGLTPGSGDDTVGYRVVKASEGKPAWTEGVRPGWRLVSIGCQEVRDIRLTEIQPILKEASLPCELGFERPPPEWHFCVECCLSHPLEAFSRKMLTKPID